MLAKTRLGSTRAILPHGRERIDVFDRGAWHQIYYALCVFMICLRDCRVLPTSCSPRNTSSHTPPERAISVGIALFLAVWVFPGFIRKEYCDTCGLHQPIKYVTVAQPMQPMQRRHSGLSIFLGLSNPPQARRLKVPRHRYKDPRAIRCGDNRSP